MFHRYCSSSRFRSFRACRTGRSAAVPCRDPAPGKFRTSEDGGVILWLGLFLGMLAVGALVIDVSMLYVAKHRAQIVSDAAVLAAAVTPDPIQGDSPSAAAIAAANHVGQINGYDATRVQTLVAASPRDGSPALRTIITEPVKLGFGFLTASGYGTVAAESWAAASPKGGLCMESVTGTLKIYNSAQVIAPNCVALAQTSFSSYNSANVVLAGAKQGNASGGTTSATAISQIRAGIQKGVAVPSNPLDTPFEADPRMAKIKSTLVDMRPAWPADAVQIDARTPAGADQVYSGMTSTLDHGNYNALRMTDSTLTISASGSADPSCLSPTTFNGGWDFTGTNTLTFQSGCYVVNGNVLARNGAHVALNVAPGAEVTFLLKAALHAYPSATMIFGDATTIMNGGSITVDAAGNVGFGNGPFWLWGGSMIDAAQASLTFGNGPFYFHGGSLTNNGTMTFGNGPFYFSGGSLTNNNTLTYGNGPYYFDGGSITFATSSSSTFGIGDFFLYGGSFTTGINGTVVFGKGGDAVMGAGTVYLRGGTQHINGTFTASGMTLAIWGGSLTFAGTGPVTMTAPTSATPALGYQDIAVAVWGGSTYMEQGKGSVATMSGLIYNVPATIYVHNYENIVMPPANGCLQIVAGIIAIYENAQVQMEPCRSFTTGYSASAGVLVQ
ncbi:MAG: Tad domain-containing protein [Alphaproteobacteria bacterium]|nr:Tad domain-containing protein [Alphaproteobacteria bacterium]